MVSTTVGAARTGQRSVAQSRVCGGWSTVARTLSYVVGFMMLGPGVCVVGACYYYVKDDDASASMERSNEASPLIPGSDERGGTV